MEETPRQPDAAAPRVLIVQPDDDLGEAYGAAIADSGLNVTRAASGAHALEALSRADRKGEPISLLVVEALLPDMMGDALCAGVRARWGRESLAIFYVSGLSQHCRDLDLWRRLTGELHVDLVLTRPVPPALLVERIHERLLGGSPGPSRARGRSDLSAPRREEILGAADERMQELLGRLEAQAEAGDAGARESLLATACRIRNDAGSVGLAELHTAALVVERALAAELEPEPEHLRLMAARIAQEIEASRRRYLQVGDDGQMASAESGVRLLMVDGSTDFLSRVLERARRYDTAVRVVPDVAAAPWVLSDFGPDIVAITWTPGDEDALRLCRQVVRMRGDDEGPPVIFMSAGESLRQRLELIQAGAAAIMAQPVSADRLLARSRELADQRLRGEGSVVIADTDADSSTFVGEVLSEAGMRVHLCRDPDALLESLSSARPELLLINRHFSVSSYDLCRMLRADRRYQTLPIILLSPERGIVDRVAAFECGADDFIGLSVSPDELTARVLGRIRRARVHSGERNHDVLTELIDHASLQNRLRAEVSTAARDGRQFCVAAIAVENLAELNDALGHGAGDVALQALGDLLQTSFRHSDVSARVSGNRFGLLLLDIDGDTARQILDATLDEYAARTLVAPGGARFRARCAVGIAAFPQDTTDADALWTKADQALKLSKTLVAQSDSGARPSLSG